MPEHYVRPPLVAREPADPRLAVWRFRVLATLLLLVLAVGAVLAFLHFSGLTSEDPGLGGALRGGVGALRLA